MTTPPDDFTTEVSVPDVPQTILALRVWRFNRAGNTILSLNAPYRVQGRLNLIAQALSADPEGGWPPSKRLEADCRHRAMHTLGIPDKDCTCGIYATTSMDIINQYLAPDAPVLGVVELGGRVIPATQGFRARYARLAAVLLVDPVLTIPHSRLKALAEHYQVPALVPHSAVAEDYRDRLVTTTPLADEVDAFLRDRR